MQRRMADYLSLWQRERMKVRDCSKRIHESDSHSAESIRPLLMRDFAPPALPRSFSEAVCQ